MPTYGLYLSTLVHEFIGIYVRKLSKYLVKMELGESIKGLIGEIRKEITSSAAENPQESSGILKLIEIIRHLAKLICIPQQNHGQS